MGMDFAEFFFLVLFWLVVEVVDSKWVGLWITWRSMVSGSSG